MLIGRWIMDFGFGAQWTASDLHEKYTNHVILWCLMMELEGEVDLVRLRGFCGYGVNMVSLRRSRGCVLKNASAMIVEREALRKGI